MAISRPNLNSQVPQSYQNLQHGGKAQFEKCALFIIFYLCLCIYITYSAYFIKYYVRILLILLNTIIYFLDFDKLLKITLLR